MINFIHPAPGSRVTSGFGRRPKPSNPKIMEGHQGIDYAKSGNVPILASADGVVKQYIGDNTSYGNVIFIQHTIEGKRMDTTYAHLKSKLVKNGDKVKQGQIIGYMGNTDGGTKTSTGQHLHFEVHDGPWKSGQPNAVNPALYVDVKKEIVIVEKKQEVATWAKDSWHWAKKQGLMDGTRPLDNLTRQELAKVLNSFYELLNK